MTNRSGRGSRRSPSFLAWLAVAAVLLASPSLSSRVAAFSGNAPWLLELPALTRSGPSEAGAVGTGEERDVATAEELSSEATTLTDCTSQPDGTACDDGNACTMGETCQAGVCLAPVSLSQPAGSPVAVGVAPFSIAAGDWNGDGILDLAVTIRASGNNVTILLGNGSGGFTATGSPVPVGTSPSAIAAGDLNRDGNLDLAVANSGSNNVTILLGDGSGGFTVTGSPVPVGLGPVSLAIADLNRDGKLDLAVPNSGTGANSVTILLGDGTGGFPTSSTVAVGTSPRSVAVGDWDRDGDLDLAVANNGTNNITVLFGDGAGAFPTSTTVGAGGGNPRSVAAGDWNKDGDLDLVVANNASASVTILLGNGNGAFSVAPGSPVAVGTNPFSVAAGDWNGDGRADLAVANNGSANVTVLLGNGAGKFPTSTTVGAGTSPTFVAAGDWDRDGALDLAVANNGSSNVTIRLNDSSCGVCATTVLTQPAGSPVPVGLSPRSVAVGDWDRDGDLDLAVGNNNSNPPTITILFGNGAGGFPTTSTVGSLGGTLPRALAAGDWDRDGDLDLAVANQGSANVTILLGNGAGGFSVAAGSPVSVGTTPCSVAAGDWDRDGDLDLAVTDFDSNNVTILLGNGSGGFPTTATVGAGSHPRAVAAGDWDRDGDLDLAVANNGSGNVTIMLGDGAGGFPTTSTVGAASGPFSVAAGDWNGDGKLDLAVANQNSANVAILIGNGIGGFPTTSTVGAGTTPSAVTAGDVNGDGTLDLAVANSGSNDVTILLGNGSGGFTAAGLPISGGGTAPLSVAVADLNGDGKLDLAVPNSGSTSNNVGILLNSFAAPDGLPCNDGNECTQTDTCQSGTCTGSNPVICHASDQCHLAGNCDPQSGLCSNPEKPDGTACSDNSVCTQGDRCQAGVCSGTAINCDDNNQCTSDTCLAGIGCTHGSLTGPCDDGNGCTVNDACQAIPGCGTFSENFDGVTAPALPAGWGQAVLQGDPTDRWQTGTVYVNSAPNSAGTNDPGTVSDKLLGTPPIVISGTSPQLTFRNYYDLEYGSDGGVLEITIGSGNFVDIITAGGSFLQGGYNGQIVGAVFSPIEGRRAWTDLSGAYITTIVNLPPAALGQTIQLVWRVASDDDGATGYNGQFIDDVVLTQLCNTCQGTVITAPGEITGDQYAPNKVDFSWTATTAASKYDVVRGALSGLPVGPGGGDETCFADIAGPPLKDIEIPPRGTGFFYLARGQNTCGNGTYGARSNLAPRVTTTCPDSICPSGWSAGAALPAVAGVRAVGIYFPANGRFYVMGGRSSDTAGSNFTSPFEYNPAGNTWVTKTATYPDSNVNNMACGVLTVGGTPQIYCVGGSAAGGTTATARIFSYNPVTDTMTTLTSADDWPGSPGGATATILPGGFAVAANKLYIIGGFNIGTGSTAQTWQFDPAAAAGSRWLQRLDYPMARSYVPAATIGGFIYTGGGSTIVGSTVTDTADSFKYNPVANVWTAIANIPRATGETRGVVMNNQMWVLGGGRSAPNPSNEVDIYTPGSNTWTVGVPFTTVRRNFPADCDGSSRVWLAGGYDASGTLMPLNTMEVYGPGACLTP